MSRYTGIRFVLISPVELKLPRYVKEQYIKNSGIPYTQIHRPGGVSCPSWISST